MRHIYTKLDLPRATRPSRRTLTRAGLYYIVYTISIAIGLLLWKVFKG